MALPNCSTQATCSLNRASPYTWVTTYEVLNPMKYDDNFNQEWNCTYQSFDHVAMVGSLRPLLALSLR